MSKKAVLRKCSQVWVVINGKYLSTSNDHLEHTGGTGYGGSSEFLPSMHELSDESDGYATPPSDFYVSFQEDDVMDEYGVIPMDGDGQLEKVLLMTSESAACVNKIN
ncbi:uncharacterized protein [Triticum aestivum]|uniref:uncharacterized protein n=1 Tax=Triticum aestivum TaxID=4565 RepID=UPI001D02D02D|nr:uncharacterized protein LOC123114906 [Triticum aestivum]